MEVVIYFLFLSLIWPLAKPRVAIRSVFRFGLWPRLFHTISQWVSRFGLWRKKPGSGRKSGGAGGLYGDELD